MTLEEIRWLSNDEIDTLIQGQTGDNKKYATDLNAAIGLVPQGDWIDDGFLRQFLNAIVTQHDDDPIAEEDELPDDAAMGGMAAWFFVCKEKPRAICEAFLLWKGSAT